MQMAAVRFLGVDKTHYEKRVSGIISLWLLETEEDTQVGYIGPF